MLGPDSPKSSPARPPRRRGLYRAGRQTDFYRGHSRRNRARHGPRACTVAPSSVTRLGNSDPFWRTSMGPSGSGAGAYIPCPGTTSGSNRGTSLLPGVVNGRWVVGG